MNVDISSWRGDWALVTGASCGIGLAFCRALAAEGMNLVLVARRADVLNELAVSLARDTGVKCLVLAHDLSEPDAPTELLRRVGEEGIRIRLLVNNAGAGHWGRFAGASADVHRQLMTLNAVAPVVLCRLFADDLASFKGAAVINLSSPAVYQPVPYMAAYAASKSAVHSFSLALSEEWRSLGVVVQTLVPGPTATEFDARAGAYGSALGEARASVESVVAASLGGLKRGDVLVTTAKGVFGQRIFGGLFPPAFVVRKVAAMFRPPAEH